MRVAFAVPGPLDDSTGGYLYDRKVVETLRRRHSVDVVEVPPRSCPAGALRSLCGYDAVLQDELCYPTLTAVNPALGAPVISVVHLFASEDPTHGRWASSVERLYMGTVDACVYTSAASRKASTVEVPSVVARPASRFETTVDKDKVRERATEDVPRAAFVGNISEVKGLDTAVRAVARTDWRLSVAGKVSDKGYGRYVRNVVASAGVGDRVEFEGFLADDELTELLRRSHAVVVPSLYESFGTVYVEGMSFGLPAVGSAAGGARELIDHGRNGWLVESGRVDEVAEVLSRLSDDREKLAEAGVEALETAEEHPSWEETGRKVVGFIERLVEG